jgi:hypothetical protein
VAKEKYTQKQVIKALAETRGMIYLAAKRLGAHPNTIANYRKKYPAVEDAVQTYRGETIDLAEAALYNAVLKGEPWAVTFFLRTVGKHRGYSETIQVDAPEEARLVITEIIVPANGREHPELTEEIAANGGSVEIPYRSTK